MTHDSNEAGVSSPKEQREFSSIPPINVDTMALSTALRLDDCDSGASGYHHYFSVVHDIIVTRSSLLAGELGLDSSARGKFRSEENDFEDIDCKDIVSILQGILLNRKCSHLDTEEGGSDPYNSKGAVTNDKVTVKSDTVNQEEEDKTSRSLPEDVMEKIIARLPFHNLFQARLLARRWASILLSPGSSETTFQSEVMASSLSSTWDSYCPIYVGMEGLIGYNLVSQVWEKILNLSYLPISDAQFHNLTSGNTAGALLSFFSTNQYTNNKLDVWVTNPLNRSWKLLHPFNLTRRSKIVLVHLECVGPCSYKVIVVTADHILEEGPDLEVFLGAQVYDSSSKCWTRYDPCTTRIEWMNVVSKWCSALVRDTLYIMGQVIFCEPVLVAYNVKDEIWSRVTISSPQPGTRFWSEALLFACGSKTMIVNIRRDSGQVVTICELNHESETANPCGEIDKAAESSNTSWSCSQMTSWQAQLLSTGPVMRIANDDKALYFFSPKDGSASCKELDVRVYDVHMQVWSSLPHSTVRPICMSSRFRESNKWAKSAFQPGLNPFVEA